MRRLRATRANPPGLASADDRRATYSAALQQHDDLMAAARTIGPVSRPLPLYYAVHQAGRAIAAAWADADDWHVRGHGLAEDTSDKTSWQNDVKRFRLKPAGIGVFGAVAKALGSAGLTGCVEVGALWSALPDVPAPPDAGRWRLAMRVFTPPYFDSVNVTGGFLDLRDQADRNDLQAVRELLAHYPDVAGTTVRHLQGHLHIGTEFSTSAHVRSPTPDGTEPGIAGRVPHYGPANQYWITPVVGACNDHLAPILAWWALMHALSLLARYEPAAWRAALDLDKSPVADPLTELLDQALDIVPDLLYEAATRDPTSG